MLQMLEYWAGRGMLQILYVLYISEKVFTFASSENFFPKNFLSFGLVSHAQPNSDPTKYHLQYNFTFSIIIFLILIIYVSYIS